MDDRTLRAAIGLSASEFNQLAQNKLISSIRVRVEHVIGGIKRMLITTDKFRNKSIYYCYIYNYNCRCCGNKIFMRDI